MIHTTRRALVAATAALCAPALLRRASAQTAPIELKVSHYLPPSHTVQKTLEAWSEELEKRSEGRLKLRIYPAGQLGPVPRQFDLARNGQADMAVGLTGSTPGRYPMSELANLPFVFPAAGSKSVDTSRRMTELAPQFLAPEYQGLRILWVGITPSATFFTARREIRGPADLKGLKIRFQSEQHAKMLRLLDAVPLQVPPGDVADSMSKGTLDGTIFNYEGAESFGLGSVTRFVAEPAFLTVTLALVANPARLESLPADLRALIAQTTGPAAAAALGTRWDAAEQHGRAYFQANKATLTQMAPDQLAKLQDILKPMLADAEDALEKAGKPARAFVTAYEA